MSIELFEKAKIAADAGDYTTALSMYQLAGRIFGEEAVAFNIKRCQSKIKNLSLQLVPDIQILLTSDIDGIKNVLPTLNSLLAQSLPPKEIILYLHKKSACDGGISLDSPDLNPIKVLPKVRICWSEKFDPFIIFNPFLSKHFECDVREDKLFLCCSDNQLYPSDFLESLYTEYLMSGNLVAANCTSLPVISDHFPISSIPNFNYGALFSTDFFDQNVCNLNDVEQVKNINAETWLTCHALLNGIGITDLNIFSCAQQEGIAKKENQTTLISSLESLMMEHYGYNVFSLYSLAKGLTV